MSSPQSQRDRHSIRCDSHRKRLSTKAILALANRHEKFSTSAGNARPKRTSISTSDEIPARRMMEPEWIAAVDPAQQCA
jgi:hypothetical protein